MRGILVLFVFSVFGVGVLLAWPRMEGEAPRLTGPDRIELSMASVPVEIGWKDDGTGLRSVDAYLELSATRDGDETGRRIALHSRRYVGSRFSGPIHPIMNESFTIDFDAKEMGLPDGTATLVLEARDWSWSDAWKGNAAELRIPVIVDTEPPRLSVRSGLTYVRRGGSAIVAYRASDDAVRSGVRVGKTWFSGFARADETRLAIFAIPIDSARDPVVEVVAIDAIGNESTVPFDVRVQERNFPEISIALSQRFLDRVATRLGEANDMTGATALATFQRVNSELRERNETQIARSIDETTTMPTAKQWTGTFEQMKNSSVTSQFAELRDYTSRGQRVSRARHFGYDLASTAHASITASNTGTVIFADDNGIYGNLVLVDHGLGVTTLYGHLSSLAVQRGDRVEKGQELGRSGATGLAGGDHLHFAVLVGKTYVDPVEWWDPKWLREHIDARLGIDTNE